MKTTIIKLDRKDDIVSIKDKMVWGKTSRIIFVVPKRGRVKFKELDLVLLRRNSDQLGVEIALVSKNKRVTTLAKRIGIPVFSETETAQKRLWRESNDDRSESLVIPKSRITSEALEAMRLNLPERKRSWTEAAPVRWIAFLLGVFSILALLALFIPKAAVVADLVEQQQTLILPVWASEQILRPNPSGGLPAHEISATMTITEEIQSSGQASWDQGFAEGILLVTNNTTGEVEIPQGTIFLTSEQPVKRFVSAETQILSADDEPLAVQVKAVEPGPTYNIAAGKIQAVEGQLGLFISASNPQSFSGGDSHQVRAPIEKDYLDLRERLIGQAEMRGSEDIQAQLIAGQVLLPASLTIEEIMSESIQPELGTPSDVLSMTMKVTVKGLYYNQADLESVIRFALDANLGDRNVAVPGTMIWREVTPPNAVEEVYRWEVFAERQIWQGWQPNTLADQLVGQKLSVSKDYLLRELLLEKPPFIEISPDWWPWLPFLSFNIHLEGR